jgi:hypothetical protein
MFISLKLHGAFENRTFFGKIRQLLFLSKNGNPERSQKDESFNHLILDVGKDVYHCLDQFFGVNEVNN